MKKLIIILFVSILSTSYAQNITEEFEDSASVVNNGWITANNSAPVGPTSWFAGNSTVFSSHSQNGYFAANYNSASGSGTISTWLLSPVRYFRNGDSIIFYTRTVDSSLIPTYPDRLQVRFSPNGTGVNVGATALDSGDFTQLLLDVNPNYDSTGSPNGYPCFWKKYTIILAGLPAQGVSGRFAFRYFVENGGPLGNRSDYIGIDSCAYRTPTNSMDENDAFSFSFYPNPVQQSTQVYLQLNIANQEVMVRILDAAGRCIRSANLSSREGELSTDGLTPGIYHLQVIHREGVLSRVLIVK